MADNRCLVVLQVKKWRCTTRGRKDHLRNYVHCRIRLEGPNVRMLINFAGMVWEQTAGKCVVKCTSHLTHVLFITLCRLNSFR